MIEDHSLPSMGSIRNIFLAYSDIHARLGTPRCMDIHELSSNSYSGCGNSVLHRGTDWEQACGAVAGRLCCCRASVKLICTVKSSWWLQVRNCGYSLICHRLSLHPSARHLTSPCYSFSFPGEANIAKYIFISRSPPPFTSKLAEGERLLGRNNWRKM